jgi:hypothetical protein
MLLHEELSTGLAAEQGKEISGMVPVKTIDLIYDEKAMLEGERRRPDVN